MKPITMAVPETTLVRDVVVTTLLVLIWMTVASSPSSEAAQENTTSPDLTGVYGLNVDPHESISAGLKSVGSPDDVVLQQPEILIQKARDLRDDPAKNCQPIGPFRMMAKEGNKIELLPSPGRITMLFEDIALGHMRTIYLTRQHSSHLEPSWMGDSIGHWEGDTLVVDTVGFNENVWLNAAGAPHSETLRLIERYRLVQGGKYLEVKMTAQDAKALAKPYTYTRYYKKLTTEIQDDVCGPSL